MKSSKRRIKRPSPMTVYSNFIHNFGTRYIIQQLWLMPLHFPKYKSELCKRAKHNCPEFFLTGGCCFYKIALGWEVSSQDKHTNPDAVAQPWKGFSPYFSTLFFITAAFLPPSIWLLLTAAPQHTNPPPKGCLGLAEHGERACTDVHVARNNNSCKSLLQANSTAVHLITSQTNSMNTLENGKTCVQRICSCCSLNFPLSFQQLSADTKNRPAINWTH